MAIHKDPSSGVWHIDLRTPSGQRIRRSARTKIRREAQEYHDKLKAIAWRQDILGQEPERTFDEAAVQLLKAKQGQADYASKVRHIAYWRTIFGGQPVRSLTTEAIMNALPTHYVRHGTSTPRACSQATQNRYLATIRSLLILAADMGWIDTEPRIRNRKESPGRVRFLTQPQARIFIDAITQPWMRDVCRFALATGMRCGEILSLEWFNVDMGRSIAWVDASNAKSGSSRPVPLGDDALDVLRGRPRDAYVFTRNGKRINHLDYRILERAFKAAGVSGFCFHDLRHTWASWHAQAGTPLFVLKELGGWKTLEMVKRYAHLAPEHLVEHANTVKFWTSSPPPSKEKALALVA